MRCPRPLVAWRFAPGLRLRWVPQAMKTAVDAGQGQVLKSPGLRREMVPLPR